MSRHDKLVKRFKAKPKDFTWRELERLLGSLGYKKVKAGKMGGSRRRFVHPGGSTISLHKPHPGNLLKLYQVEQVLETLNQEDLI